MNFTEWLMKKKSLQPRSARDVESRIKRLKKLSTKFNTLKEDALIELIENETTSPFVRSQLKRAFNLYREFELKN